MVLPQGILLCQTFQVIFAGNPYAVSLLPRGDCHLCCETKLEDDVIFMSHFRTGPSLRAGVAAGAPMLDPNKPTVIYVHGFTDQATGRSATSIGLAYFASGRDVNYLTVDWARLSAFPWYANAVDNVPVVGRYLARFLERLFEDGVDPQSVHLIGYSIGAQVAGLAGKSLGAAFRLGRITGLDPAFPATRWARREDHLDSGDAQFVDVIHTDGGVYGVLRALGHADFYPNGGRHLQPGCNESELRAKGLFPQEFIGCSHSRAWVYYAESLLRPHAFAALRCGSEADFRSGRCQHEAFRFRGKSNDTTTLAVMGVEASPGCRGSYFLDTNDQFPFARGVFSPLTQ